MLWKCLTFHHLNNIACPIVLFFFCKAGTFNVTQRIADRALLGLARITDPDSVSFYRKVLRHVTIEDHLELEAVFG